MDINYSTYTYDELLDVEQHIDKNAFPERYQQLLKEIELRKTRGETSSLKSLEEIDEDNSKLWNSIFVYNFDQFAYRALFGSIFVAIIAGLLIQILPSVFHTRLSNLPEYKTEIQFIQCQRETYQYKGKTRSYYNLKVRAYGFSFYVIDMKKASCQRAEQQLKNEEVLTIWYEGDLIYQLADQKGVVLPYRYLKRYVWHEKINNVFNFIVLLILFITTFYKSFINCIRPYTFTIE